MLVTETKRLLIRELCESDFDVLVALHDDAQVMEFSPQGRPLTREETQQFLTWVQETYSAYGYGLWAVVERTSGAVIGYCGITNYTINNQTELEIGYRFAPQYWGNGYATEASYACAQVAFTRFGAEQVISVIEPQNHASIRVAKKNGFEFAHELRIYDIPVEIYILRKGAAQ